MITLSIITSVIFLVLAAIHLYWAIGGLWPGKNTQELTNKVLGKGNKFPSPVECLVVSFGLSLFSLICLTKFNIIDLPFTSSFKDALLLLIGAVFALRAIIFFLPKLKLYGTSDFKRLNMLVYAPLCLTISFFIFILSFEYLFLNVVSCQSKLEDKPSEAILYFSADGRSQKKLNYISKYRLDHVIKIHTEGQRVFLNGHARAKPPTVELAKAYLVDGGINPDLITFETKSTNTYENLQVGLKRIKKLNLKSVTMVSSPYHIERILRYYKKQNITQHYDLDVSWDSYPHKLDDIYPTKKAAQILHEILGTIRDTVVYGNELSSGMCN
jgi:uncharacterized SAM-binding protein YcdF (DUF218 family)